MSARVIGYAPESEYYFEEGCYITELSNDSDDAALSIARARVPPGVTTRLHRLRGVSERYVVLEGEGMVQVGELPMQRVAAGDVVIIPPLTPQRIRNSGAADLVFLALCTPRFTRACYELLETDTDTDTTA